MLRLTELQAHSGVMRLKVEGSVTHATLPVLAEELDRALAGTDRIQLDFRDVVYLDGAGADLLRKLPHQRVEIVDCTPLIRQLLSKEPT